MYDLLNALSLISYFEKKFCQVAIVFPINYLYNTNVTDKPVIFSRVTEQF